MLVDAGLSPSETLATAMTIAGRFLGVQGRLGTVEAGKSADLVLLEPDPLRDISAVRKVARVMLEGAWVEATLSR